MLDTLTDWMEVRERVQYTFTIYERHSNVEVGIGVVTIL